MPKQITSVRIHFSDDTSNVVTSQRALGELLNSVGYREAMNVVAAWKGECAECGQPSHAATEGWDQWTPNETGSRIFGFSRCTTHYYPIMDQPPWRR